jgi:hypothetical protein
MLIQGNFHEKQIHAILCQYTKVIHVSPDGNDTGSGTVSEPFLTLVRAKDEVRNQAAGMKKGRIEVILFVFLRVIINREVFA